MRQDLTEIVVVIDRSGSMELCRAEAEHGLAHFIKEQKELPGECIFTLVQFDTEYEFVHRAVPIAQVGEFQLVPRGCTALYDAIGRAVVETGERLSKMNEADRPGLVCVVILTDGYENSSREYDAEKIKQLIERQQTLYSWQFNFLAANQDAILSASSIGIGAARAAMYDAHAPHMAFVATSGNVTRMRKMSADGYEVVNEYTTDERSSMSKDDSQKSSSWTSSS